MDMPYSTFTSTGGISNNSHEDDNSVEDFNSKLLNKKNKKAQKKAGWFSLRTIGKCLLLTVLACVLFSFLKKYTMSSREFNLEKQAKEHKVSDADSDDSNFTPYTSTGKVMDKDFYEVMGVAIDASPQDIRKAYLKKSIEYHPDKNPNNVEWAKKMFVQLRKAYGVLSNNASRTQYDKKGKNAFKDMEFEDLPVWLIFSSYFGSDKFSSYLGRLVQGVIYEKTSHDSGVPAASDVWGLVQEYEAIQNRRIALLGLRLRQRLQNYMSKDPQTWSSDYKKEIKELCKELFGEKYMAYIGWAYKNVGTAYLAERDGDRKTVVKQHMSAVWHEIQNTVKKLSFSFYFGLRVFGKIGRLYLETKLFNRLPSEDIYAETIPTMLRSLLQNVKSDVEDTSWMVANLVVRDASVGEDVRAKRAAGLIEMGKIMEECAAEARKFKLENNMYTLDSITAQAEGKLDAMGNYGSKDPKKRFPANLNI